MTKTELNKLKKAAQENANYFNRPYMLFSDTSGKYRVEKDNINAKHSKEVFYPQIVTNPRPRLGTTKPRRASSSTGKRPTARLVARRLKNTRKGVFPNPAPKQPKALYLVQAEQKGKWHTVSNHPTEQRAIDHAKKLSAVFGLPLRVWKD